MNLPKQIEKKTPSSNVNEKCFIIKIRPPGSKQYFPDTSTEI